MNSKELAKDYLAKKMRTCTFVRESVADDKCIFEHPFIVELKDDEYIFILEKMLEDRCYRFSQLALDKTELFKKIQARAIETNPPLCEGEDFVVRMCEIEQDAYNAKNSVSEESSIEPLSEPEINAPIVVENEVTEHIPEKECPKATEEVLCNTDESKPSDAYKDKKLYYLNIDNFKQKLGNKLYNYCKKAGLTLADILDLSRVSLKVQKGLGEKFFEQLDEAKKWIPELPEAFQDKDIFDTNDIIELPVLTNEELNKPLISRIRKALEQQLEIIKRNCAENVFKQAKWVVNDYYLGNGETESETKRLWRVDFDLRFMSGIGNPFDARCFVSDSLLAEIKEAGRLCSYEPASKALEVFGLKDNTELLNNKNIIEHLVGGLSITEKKEKLDDIYVIPDNYVGIYKSVIDDVIKNLHAAIVPLSLEELSNNCAVASKNKVFMNKVLEQHSWIEYDGETGCYSLKLQHYDQGKLLARIVFDAGGKHLKETDIADTYNKIKGSDIDAKTVKSSLKTIKVLWLKNIQSGEQGVDWTWYYDNSGTPNAIPLFRFFKTFISEKEIFRLSEIGSVYKNTYGIDVNSDTLKNYAQAYTSCFVCKDDADLWCKNEYVGEYSNYEWLEKTTSGSYNRVINIACELLGYKENISENEQGELKPISFTDLEKTINEKMDSEGYRPRNVYQILKEYSTLLTHGESEYSNYHTPFISIHSKKNYRKSNIILNASYLEAMGNEYMTRVARKKNLPYYQATKNRIVEVLKDCEGGLCPANKLYRLVCTDEYKELRQAFYSIIRLGELPDGVSIIEKDNKKFYQIKLGDSLIVSDKVLNKLKIENEEVIVETRERLDYAYGHMSGYSADDLKGILSNLLNKYSKTWEIENKILNKNYTIDSAVNGLVDFICASNSNRLKNLLNKTYCYFIYKQDIYTIQSYFSELAVCYERLLKVCYINFTGKELPNVKGLYEIVNSYMEMKKWINSNYHSNFNKTYHYLRKQRNDMSHGEDIMEDEQNMAFHICNFIALYVRTYAVLAS